MKTKENTMAKTLTDAELAELKRKALANLSVCRRNLILLYPFIGSIAFRMEMVPVRDKRLATAATDGDKVFFDIAFMSTLSDDELKFVLAHEVWHAVLMHLERLGGRDMQLFNIATDMEVNYLLKNDGLKGPKWIIMPDKKCAGKCAEEIYEILLKQQKQKSQDSMDGKGQGNGQGNDSGSGSDDGQFDTHVYNGREYEISKGKVHVSDKYGEVGDDPDFHPAVSKNFKDNMREIIVSEAQRIERQRGTLPAMVKDLVKQLLTPEIKWQEQLAKFVTKCYKSCEYRWTPPNRRHVYNGSYFQSRYANRIRVACIIDTSGSTTSDRTKFLTELHSLVNSFGQFDLDIICCDAEVHKHEHFTEDDVIDFENEGYEFEGGGGTAMLPAFEFINENGIEADAVVVFTDGYIDVINESPVNMPVLWVLTKDGNANDLKFGEVVQFKNDDEKMIDD